MILKHKDYRKYKTLHDHVASFKFKVDSLDTDFNHLVLFLASISAYPDDQKFTAAKTMTKNLYLLHMAA